MSYTDVDNTISHAMRKSSHITQDLMVLMYLLNT